MVCPGGHGHIAATLKGNPPRPGIWRQSTARSKAPLACHSSATPPQSNVHHEARVLGSLWAARGRRSPASQSLATIHDCKHSRQGNTLEEWACRASECDCSDFLVCHVALFIWTGPVSALCLQFQQSGRGFLIAWFAPRSGANGNTCMSRTMCRILCKRFDT